MLVRTKNLTKNLGGELGLRKSFKGAGVKISLKIYFKFVKIPRNPKKCYLIISFFSQKIQNLIQKCHFFQKFHRGGGGDTLSHLPP
jgi:hypothetical protein